MDTSDVIAGEVHMHVCAEHERVRLLLSDFVRSALQTGHKVRHWELRDGLALLRAAAERAIGVEERELAPLLRSDEVAELRERHAAVLRALDDFAQDVAEGHHHCDLVARTEQLVSAFSADIDEGELVFAAEPFVDAGRRARRAEGGQEGVDEERLPR